MAPFIVVEGLDGAGTTTQVARLMERYAAAGRPALATREPTGRAVGRLIRRVLAADPEAPSPRTLPWLFAADRADLVERQRVAFIGVAAQVDLDLVTLGDSVLLVAIVEDGVHWAGSGLEGPSSVAGKPDESRPTCSAPARGRCGSKPRQDTLLRCPPLLRPTAPSPSRQACCCWP